MLLSAAVNGVGDAGATAFAEALLENSTLTDLNLEAPGALNFSAGDGHGAARPRACRGGGCGVALWITCRCRLLYVDSAVGPAASSALEGAVQRNFALQCLRLTGGGDSLRGELRCRYRLPHVRLVLRTRVLCQAGRAGRAATITTTGPHWDTMAWLMERAPLWVVARVCGLLG